MIRFGILGAARIAPAALIRPARAVAEVQVAAVAARDPGRAAQFARRWNIGRVHQGYQAIIDDPDLDAVYLPLPNSMHAQWTQAALAAGKHVLCEKPFTSNAGQAAEVAEVASGSPQVVMEAFHYRYHPLVRRVLRLVADGAIGPVVEVHAKLCIPLPRWRDIRYQFLLGGGATMDVGCYALHWLRTFGPGEPQVASARALRRGPDIDRAMSATLVYPGGQIGTMTCSLWSRTVLAASLRLRGEQGELRVVNPIAPHIYHRLSVRTGRRSWHEKVPGEPTYTSQLRAFVAAVTVADPVLTGAGDAVRTMRLIDAVYQAAGLPLRP